MCTGILKKISFHITFNLLFKEIIIIPIVRLNGIIESINQEFVKSRHRIHTRSIVATLILFDYSTFGKKKWNATCSIHNYNC